MRDSPAPQALPRKVHEEGTKPVAERVDLSIVTSVRGECKYKERDREDSLPETETRGAIV